jgi:hypothetical protein
MVFMGENEKTNDQPRKLGLAAQATAGWLLLKQPSR